MFTSTEKVVKDIIKRDYLIATMAYNDLNDDMKKRMPREFIRIEALIDFLEIMFEYSEIKKTIDD